MLRQNTRAEFERLLQLRNQHPDQSAEIDTQIHHIFGETQAVLVLDMSGFSRLTVRYGIIHFLAMIQRMEAIATPILHHHQGKLVKQDADNLIAVFAHVECAVAAAIHMLTRFAVVNCELPDALDLYASIGIGYGDMLVVEGKDLFGHEMNLASKLGEDLARPNEILLTDSAYQQMQNHPYRCDRLELSIAGLQLTAHKVRFSLVS